MVGGRERGKKGKRWAAAGGECILGICSRRRQLSFFAATPHHSAANSGGTSNLTLTLTIILRQLSHHSFHLFAPRLRFLAETILRHQFLPIRVGLKDKIKFWYLYT